MDRTQLRLTADEREAYEEDGFFARHAVLPEAELVALREAAERVAAGAEASREKPDQRYAIDGNVYLEAEGSTIQLEHAPGSDTLRVIEPFHHLDPLLDALMDDPRLVEPIRGLVASPRVSLYTDKLNLKRPLEGSGFRWHQDSPYWHHFCDHLDRLPNVMVVLDDADEGNGCFRVVRGSHKEGCLPGLHGDGQLGPLFTDPAAFDIEAQVPIVVPAGSLVFFSAHTVHGSEPNRSERPRRAFVVTYQPAGHPMFKRPGEREVDAPAA
ncbi:MAG: phytanoyl-CoA dioxygenase family protein [Deltaproteobacteria bacterium]|nr:phytanoyl-CoA dioxygenase family protein [Deltaproteobacteria bacterium]MBW2445107.1 phytanoyl-CoA dioxygenase family protein [Deltaproteobacteria bacterium]